MHMAIFLSMKIFRIGISVLFFVLLCLGLFFVNEWTKQLRIDPASFAHAGSVIKDKFPGQYDMYTDEVAGRHLLGKGYITEEQMFAFKSAGLSDKEINDLIVKNLYTREEKMLFYVEFLVAWAALYAFLFWSIDKLPAFKK